MHKLFCLLFCILVYISITAGLNCIVCSSVTNVACDEPFLEDLSTSSALSRSGFTSCLKTAYWKNWNSYTANTVIREGSYTSCISPTTIGNVANLYCCSDKDNCNNTTTHVMSIFITISLLIVSYLAKQIFSK